MESFTEPQVTSEEQAASNVKRTHEDDEPLSSNKKAKTDAVMAGAHLSDTILSVSIYPDQDMQAPTDT